MLDLSLSQYGSSQHTRNDGDIYFGINKLLIGIAMSRYLGSNVPLSIAFYVDIFSRYQLGVLTDFRFQANAHLL